MKVPKTELIADINHYFTIVRTTATSTSNTTGTTGTDATDTASYSGSDIMPPLEALTSKESNMEALTIRESNMRRLSGKVVKVEPLVINHHCSSCHYWHYWHQ